MTEPDTQRPIDEELAQQALVVAQTPRLTIRHLTSYDATFLLVLLNDASFLEHIGDKGVRTIDQAIAYLREGPMASYERHGHGLYAVVLTEAGKPIGICGLLKRDEYPDIDLGYAFLPEFRGAGYAFESAAAVLELASSALRREKVIALVSPANDASIRLLEKLGFSRAAEAAATPDTVIYERCSPVDSGPS